MDISKVTNSEARRFLLQFLSDREINREFYTLVPENKYDFRMVNTPMRKSDSPRESLCHQIDTERDYINGVKKGKLSFRIKYNDLQEIDQLSKDKLLKMLQKEDEELIKILSNPKISSKVVLAPWSKTPLPFISVIWALDSHEILHTGWILALMDHLNIPRFKKLQQVWG